MILRIASPCFAEHRWSAGRIFTTVGSEDFTHGTRGWQGIPSIIQLFLNIFYALAQSYQSFMTSNVRPEVMAAIYGIVTPGKSGVKAIWTERKSTARGFQVTSWNIPLLAKSTRCVFRKGIDDYICINTQDGNQG
jgi:hypothetical protein